MIEDFFRLLGTLKGYVSIFDSRSFWKATRPSPSQQTPQNLLRKNPHVPKKNAKEFKSCRQASSNINWDVIPKVNVDRPLRICFDLKHAGYVQSKSMPAASSSPPFLPQSRPRKKKALKYRKGYIVMKLHLLEVYYIITPVSHEKKSIYFIFGHQKYRGWDTIYNFIL